MQLQIIRTHIIVGKGANFPLEKITINCQNFDRIFFHSIILPPRIMHQTSKS